MALHHHGDAHRHGESVSSPVQIMILSLFFQLLVFFILMNSISTFTPKAVGVIKSMKDSMGGSQDLPMLQGSSLFPFSGTQHGEGTSLAALGGAFEHEAPGLAPARVKESGVLEMIMAGSALNAMLGASTDQKLDPRLDRLVEFIKTHDKPRYKIMLIGHVRPTLFLQAVERRALDPSFVVYWASRLRAAGIPPGQLEFGVAPGHPGSVTIRIMPVSVLVPAAVPEPIKPSAGGV